jgi:hypothetical protein
MQTAECRVETGAARESGQVVAGEPLGRTPLRTFVVGECANAQAGDRCLSLEKSGCLVVRGRRCRYFEESVLPLLTRCASARCLKLYPEALSAYQKLHRELDGMLVPEATRFCPCGKPLKKRQRYCDACAKARRKAATRARVARHRGAVSCNALTEKDARIPSETRMVFRAQGGIRGIGQGTASAAVNCCAPMPGAGGQEAIR